MIAGWDRSDDLHQKETLFLFVAPFPKPLDWEGNVTIYIYIYFVAHCAKASTTTFFKEKKILLDQSGSVFDNECSCRSVTDPCVCVMMCICTVRVDSDSANPVQTDSDCLPLGTLCSVVTCRDQGAGNQDTKTISVLPARRHHHTGLSQTAIHR